MWHRIFRGSAIALAAFGSSGTCADTWADDNATQTPIKHVIVLIGENHSFDNVFATYKASRGQSVGNLLSRGIIKPDGSPGPILAQQSNTWSIRRCRRVTLWVRALRRLPIPRSCRHRIWGALPTNKSARRTSPQTRPAFNDNQFTDAQLASLEPSLEKSDLFLLRTGATGAAGTSGPDTRVANYATLPNTAFPLMGPTPPYDSYTGDMAHRLFHMWQQSDCNVNNATVANLSGCLNDLYPFVGIARR